MVVVTGPAAGIAGVAAVAVDCADPAELAAFWQRLLGGDVEVDDDGDASLRGAAAVTLDFLRVPEGKTVKNRLHLDLRAGDFETAVRSALAAGASRADDVYDGGRWQVLRDPEGNEFCILRPRP
jgi:catechol 2,3-dioxygenase-like lactoylglutathione lyase family enzyme